MAKKPNDMEAQLAGQIPEFNENEGSVRVETQQPAPQEPGIGMVGGKLGHTPGMRVNQEEINQRDAQTFKEKKLTGIGGNILKNSFIRDGWLPVDRALLGERDQFYPADWKFYIRPATVEAIRNWSMIDDQNGNSIDDVFNEVLKTCLSIKRGDDTPLPWYNVNSWDRFFFILLVRRYTFAEGEQKISYTEECPNCEADVTFELNYDALMYDMPDADIMPMFDRETKTWMIDPVDYDVEGEPMTFYVPTLEKEANIKAWMISKLQQNNKAKFDPVFIKFLGWIAPKISKDAEIANRQIKQYKTTFESWDVEQFSFWNDVIANITVTPATTIKATCPSCGEEVTSQIRFPNGVSGLFAVQSRHKKFGSKSAVSK